MYEWQAINSLDYSDSLLQVSPKVSADLHGIVFDVMRIHQNRLLEVTHDEEVVCAVLVSV